MDFRLKAAMALFKHEVLFLFSFMLKARVRIYTDLQQKRLEVGNQGLESPANPYIYVMWHPMVKILKRIYTWFGSESVNAAFQFYTSKVI